MGASVLEAQKRAGISAFKVGDFWGISNSECPPTAIETMTKPFFEWLPVGTKYSERVQKSGLRPTRKCLNLKIFRSVFERIQLPGDVQTALEVVTKWL